MPGDLEPLILDLLEWAAREPRAYADVMDAWRTSCPRLTVWEDAIDRGLLRREFMGGKGVVVTVMTDGWALLGAHGRSPDAHAGVATRVAARLN